MGNNFSKNIKPDEKTQDGLKKIIEAIGIKQDKIKTEESVYRDSGLYDYGNIETLRFSGEEADLHRHFKQCTKDPGHENFIPFTKFTIEDLPEKYRDVLLYEYIKAAADVTVRLSVSKTSRDRPKFWPNTRDPYPFYNSREARVGTGEIEVWKFSGGRGFSSAEGEFDLNNEKYVSQFGESIKACPCKKCKTSNKPSNVWFEISVFTSRHVVFDDYEAESTTCRLYFDEEKSPLVTLDEYRAGFKSTFNIHEDKSWLNYVTCESTGEDLYDKVKRFGTVWWKIQDKFKDDTSEDRLTIIVSHPHGCHKYVSIGDLTSNEVVRTYDNNYDITNLTYTTSTCPGSSGSKVLCVGLGHAHYHRGAYESGLNYSAVGQLMARPFTDQQLDEIHQEQNRF